MFEGTAVLSNNNILDTGAKEIPLIHMYMNSYFNIWLC